MKKTRLTKEYLIENGFSETIDIEIEYRDEVFYEKQINYHDYMRVYLGDYPETNPNCGIIRIHSTELKARGIPFDLYDKDEWTDLDKKRAEKFGAWLKPKVYNIASGVYDVDRFIALYYGLTGNISLLDSLPFEKK